MTEVAGAGHGRDRFAYRAVLRQRSGFAHLLGEAVAGGRPGPFVP
ncbi:hypothetical protein ACFVW8_23070 [Streptomyces sp. NPDC058221]